MDDLLPLLLWLFAAGWALCICVLCVLRGRFLGRDRHPEVEPVSWNVVAAQMASMVFAGLPFVIYGMDRSAYSPGMRAFYDRYLLAGVVIAILLVIAELIMMYCQASRAHRTQIDRMLKR